MPLPKEKKKAAFKKLYRLSSEQCYQLWFEMWASLLGSTVLVGRKELTKEEHLIRVLSKHRLFFIIALIEAEDLVTCPACWIARNDCDACPLRWGDAKNHDVANYCLGRRTLYSKWRKTNNAKEAISIISKMLRRRWHNTDGKLVKLLTRKEIRNGSRQYF